MADDPIIPPVKKPPIPPGATESVETDLQSAQPEVDPGEIEAVNQAKQQNDCPDKEA